MSENTIDLDFGTTAQKQQDGEKLPVVLLALDQGKYDMARSLDELRALADAETLHPRSRHPAGGGQGGRSAACLPKFERCGSYF